MSERRGADERIEHGEIGETAEVPVGRPEFAHAMLNAERRDTCIVYLRPCNVPALEQNSEL